MGAHRVRAGAAGGDRRGQRPGRTVGHGDRRRPAAGKHAVDDMVGGQRGLRARWSRSPTATRRRRPPSSIDVGTYVLSADGDRRHVVDVGRDDGHHRQGHAPQRPAGRRRGPGPDHHDCPSSPCSRAAQATTGFRSAASFHCPGPRRADPRRPMFVNSSAGLHSGAVRRGGNVCLSGWTSATAS